MNPAPYQLSYEFIFALHCLWTLKTIFSWKPTKKIIIVVNAFKMQPSIMMPHVLLNTSLNFFHDELFELRIKIRELLLYFITCI